MNNLKEIEEFIEGWKEAISFNKGEIRSLQNEDKEQGSNPMLLNCGIKKC